MITIHKYPLKPEHNVILLPEGAKPLCVQVQQGCPVMWALVNTEQPKQHRIIHVFGTGERLPNEPGDYIGTFQMNLSTLVWHVFLAA